MNEFIKCSFKFYLLIYKWYFQDKNITGEVRERRGASGKGGVAGMEKGLELLRPFSGAEAILVDID